MSKAAIVAALEREVHPLVKNWRRSDKVHDSRTFRFFESEKWIVVCGGVGAEAARRAAEAAMALYEPNVIYSAGFAGALESGLKVGDILQPARVVNVSDGSSITVDGGVGVLVSFSSVASPEQKAKLHESFGAQAVDMEAAAVGRAAEARGVAFRVAKVISDEVHFKFPSVERFVDSSGNFSETRFALFAAIRPWMWLQIYHLASNSKRASSALCERLRQLLLEHASSSAQARPSAAI